MRWKFVAISLLVIAVLLPATGYLFLRTRDFNSYKNVIANAVKDATGRELSLEGDVDLEISFWPALVVTDVALANTLWGSQPEMIRIHRLEVRLSLLRLLVGNVDLKQMAMLGVDLVLETDAAGLGNWDFNHAEGSGGHNPWTFTQLDVRYIRIEDLHLLFHNGETGSRMRLSVGSLNASKDASEKVLDIDLKGEFNKQMVALSGQTGLISDLFARNKFPVNLSGQIASAAIKVRGAVSDVVDLKGIDLEISASGKDLAEVASTAGISVMNTDAFDVKGHVEGSAATLALKEAKGNLSIKGVEIDVDGSIGEIFSLDDIDLQIKASGRNLAEVGPVIKQSLPETGPFTLSGRLTGSVKALALQDARGKASHRSLNLTLNGAVKDLLALSGLNLNAELSGRNLAEVGPVIKQSLPETGPFTLSGRLTGSVKALALQDARGKASHRSLNLTLSGDVKDLLALSGLNLNVWCSGGELSDMGPWAGVNLPELGRFDVRSHLTGSAKLLELDGLSALVDQSDLNGSARVEFRKRPKITAILESALLDLTPLMKVGKAEAIKVAENMGRDRGLFSDEPLPFDKLEAVDVDITLNARNIRSRDARWEFGRLAIKLEEGDLRVERLEAAYKGTKVSGTAFFQAGSPSHVEAKFLVQGFDLGAFLREVQVSEKVKGRLDIAADVSSRGNSVKTLLGKLNGTAGVVMGQGYLSKYLDWLAQDLTRKVIPFWGDQEKAGVIDCAVIQFDIKNGLATSQAFVLNSPVSVLTGEGTVNLETEKVNFLLSPSPKYPSLFSLATNLQVTGTIQNPEVRPNLASLALKGARALSVFLVGPVGLLAPFINLGASQQHPCDITKIGEPELQAMPTK
jgi:uncharacterized protein involved in outer membrane biogenesis